MKRNLLLSPEAAAGAPPAAPSFGGLPSGGAPPTRGEERAGMQEAFDLIDGKPPAAEPAPAPAKAAAPKPAPAKAPARVEPAKPEPPKVAPAKAAAPAKEPAKTEPEPDVEKMAPKALRDAYAGLKTKLKTIEKERDELKSKPATAPADDPDRERIRTDLESERKRRNELEDHMRYVDYEKSTEYQERYHKPYIETAKDAAAQVMQLEAVGPDGNPRAATADDFWSIARIDNAGQALKAATDLFGDAGKATFVMQQRENVRRAWHAAQIAKEEFRKNGAERSRRAEEEGRATEKQLSDRWHAMNKAATEEHEWLRPAENDDDGNALLEKGFETADALFGGQITDDKTGQKRQPTRDEALQIHSDVRNRAAAFPRVHAQLEKARERITELEASLKQYEESAPGAGETEGGEKPAAGGDEIDQIFDAAMRK